ncbi:MAG: uL22 family ribosomal protein, partial [Candidatus Orphnella occulta]|nr:uL22 family ribosomal protein [Candidatus Orphnella occulta]
MISKAVAKYLRISPRKVRTVIALIKNKHVDEAIGILNLTNKKAAFLLLKVLNSAIANAKR